MYRLQYFQGCHRLLFYSQILKLPHAAGGLREDLLKATGFARHLASNKKALD
jgi:hypothetical protein